MPKKEIDKYTFKICEAVKLGLDKFFLEENKPIKITEGAHGLRKKDHSDLAAGLDAAKALLGRLQEISQPKHGERRKFYVRNK